MQLKHDKSCRVIEQWTKNNTLLQVRFWSALDKQTCANAFLTNEFEAR